MPIAVLEFESRFPEWTKHREIGIILYFQILPKAQIKQK